MPQSADPAQMRQVLLLLSLGVVGGSMAWIAGAPLPFMLGALGTTILFVIWANRQGREVAFPRLLRMIFVGMIGAMIGSSFDPDLLGLLPGLGATIACVTIYVILAHGAGYSMCRRIGGYDKVTAFYSAMPGGLIEAVALGTRGGGDVRILTLTHFLRVLIVVVTMPLIFTFTSGDLVGSASGQSFDRGGWGWSDVLLVVAITGVGLTIARGLHLPAGHLMGPLVLSAVLHGSGIVSTSSPEWLLFLAQLFVGVGLGAQFSGAGEVRFPSILRVAVAITVMMLGLSAIAALVMTRLTGFSFDLLFLSFAPGGVSEMGLIALSISLSPMIVAAHHVYRIFLTVLIATLSTRFLVTHER